MDWKTDAWTSIEEINKNQKFNKGDGIRVKDINVIFNNIFFMKGN
jgi:hypothetical protein